MTAAELAGAKYQQTMLSTSSPRAIESEALSRISAELSRTYGKREENYPAYVTALSRNLALWTQFAADVSSPGNPLPDEIRAGVIRLAAFVRADTFRLQRSRSESGIAALLEINVNVAAGLRQSHKMDD